MAKIRCMGCMNEYEDSNALCPICGSRKNLKQKEPYYLNAETVLDDRYIVGKAQNSDSYGITYLAWDSKDNCRVLIKEYFPQNLASRQNGQSEVVPYDGKKLEQFESGLKNFIKTSSELVAVSHNLDGIVRTECNFIENSTAYYVMEYLDGVDFNSVVQGRRMSWQDTVRVLEPVLNSLQTIHTNNIINYNISPENIIMTRDRSVKLRGFEEAKLFGDKDVKSRKESVSPGFSPYEMYRSDSEVTPAADVYSMAAVIYYAITGIVIPAAVDRYDNDTVRPPSKLGIEIPRNVENAIMNALCVDSKYRTKSCKEFLAQIHSVEPVERVVEVRKKEDTGKLSKRTKIILSASATAALCVIVAIVLLVTGTIGFFSTDKEHFPDLKGMTEEAMVTKLEEIGIKNAGDCYSIVGTVESEEVDPDTVVWQSIEPNKKLSNSEKESLTFQIKMAKAKETKPDLSADTFSMPNLVNMTKKQARKALKNYGYDLAYCKFKTETKANYDGTVFEQSIEPGTTTSKTAYLVVKVGAKKAEKSTQSTTATQATTQPTTTKATTQPTATKPTTQATTKSSKTSKSKTSSTVTYITIPDVAGTGKSSGVTTLESKGLSVYISYVDTDDESLNEICKSTSPAAGKKVTNNQVTLYVYQY